MIDPQDATNGGKERFPASMPSGDPGAFAVDYVTILLPYWQSNYDVKGGNEKAR